MCKASQRLFHGMSLGFLDKKDKEAYAYKQAFHP